MIGGDERALVLEEELLIVRHSGEIPEIAYHSTLHYLCDDPEGPAFILAAEELRPLQDAAIERYQEIILRDLDPENRDLPLFRGVLRAICNWQRFKVFCNRIERDWTGFKPVARRALYRFLLQEEMDIGNGTRSSSVNCSVQELKHFAAELELHGSKLPNNLVGLCQQEGRSRQ